VDTTILGEVRTNDLVLVHAGTAITRLEADS
jgi:hydrogenase maturation factor